MKQFYHYNTVNYLEIVMRVLKSGWVIVMLLAMNVLLLI